MSEWNKKRDMMHRYDVTAHIYDMRYAEEQTAKIKAAFKHVKIDKDSCVLDVGCGTGILFNHVADKVETLVGLDISRKTLFEARKRAGCFQNVHLVLADADCMPFEASFFGYVFAFTFIQNVPDDARTLDEIKRVAKEDAVLIVTGLKKVYPLEGFERLLRNSGFEIHALERERLQCYVAICLKLHR